MKQTKYYENCYKKIEELYEDFESQDIYVQNLIKKALEIKKSIEECDDEECYEDKIYAIPYVEINCGKDSKTFHIYKNFIKHLKKQNQIFIKDVCIGNYCGYLGYLIISELPELCDIIDVQYYVEEVTDIFSKEIKYFDVKKEKERRKRNKYNRFQIMSLD